MSTPILHVTPHMGGGVGRVLKHFIAASARDPRFAHEVACLDFANESAIQWSRDAGVTVLGEMSQRPRLLADRVRAASITHIHWWNHPLLYHFLNSAEPPASRSVIWAHVNGYHAPHPIIDPVLDYADLFVLGTSYSRNVPAIAKRSKQWRTTRLRTVFASSGFEHIEHVKPEKHHGFNVGYIGTVDYAKMHPEYLAMHAAADVLDLNCIVCGGSREEELRQQALSLGIADRFDIRGHVADVGKVLGELDVFGYPLQPQHYGASEIALIEALVAGVVPVVLKNGCESELVRDGHTGIVAETPEQFTRAIEYLHRNPKVRKQMSERAKAEARDRFHISRTVKAWHEIYEEMRLFPKRTCQLTAAGVEDHTLSQPARMFLQSLGTSDEADLLRRATLDPPDAALKAQVGWLDPIFHGLSNGSVFQYRRFFPEDGQLERLAEFVASSTRSSTQAA